MRRLPHSRLSSPAHHHAGFTLIEVMMVVALIAILTALGYPSYRDYLIRGALTDATTGLAAMRAQMERHFLDNRTYATVGDFVTPCQSENVGQRTFGNFVISCDGEPTATTFTLQAVGGGTVDQFVFKVNQNDVRSTTSALEGWPTCASAWLTKKGQTC